MNISTKLLMTAVLASAAGCLSVKTESEIKPIHITMDVNLKVDKELDKAFADENLAKPKGDFAEIKSLLDRQAAGLSNRAMLEPRAGATDDDKILIAEANVRRMKRFNQIAKDSGVSLEAVQKRSAKRFAEKVSAGSGIWIQSEAGEWQRK